MADNIEDEYSIFKAFFSVSIIHRVHRENVLLHRTCSIMKNYYPLQNETFSLVFER